MTVRVSQKNAPPGWRMLVPVRFELKGKRFGQILLMIDQPEKTFKTLLPERPKKVVFNPDHAILARVKGQ